MMSPSTEVLEIGGEVLLSHEATGGMTARYMTVIWNLKPRNLGWRGGLSSVARATPAKVPSSLLLKSLSARALSKAPSKHPIPRLMISAKLLRGSFGIKVVV